jgi:hypothetical protein
MSREVLLESGKSGSRLRPAGGRLRPGLVVIVAALVPILWGCDSRPTGVGSVTVSVEWDAGVEGLGGAVLFLGAPGMGEVTGLDGARVWQHTPSGEEGGMHVVLLHTGQPSALRFTVGMADVSVGVPQVTLYEVVTQANQPLYPPLDGYRVRVF